MGSLWGHTRNGFWPRSARPQALIYLARQQHHPYCIAKADHSTARPLQRPGMPAAPGITAPIAPIATDVSPSPDATSDVHVDPDRASDASAVTHVHGNLNLKFPYAPH
jgi:hypothetical protein